MTGPRSWAYKPKQHFCKRLILTALITMVFIKDLGNSGKKERKVKKREEKTKKREKANIVI